MPPARSTRHDLEVTGTDIESIDEVHGTEFDGFMARATSLPSPRCHQMSAWWSSARHSLITQCVAQGGPGGHAEFGKDLVEVGADRSWREE